MISSKMSRLACTRSGADQKPFSKYRCEPHNTKLQAQWSLWTHTGSSRIQHTTQARADSTACTLRATC